MILIVDDHTDTALALKRMLQMDGIPAICETDPQNAVALVEKERPLLLVLDYNMPHLTGVEVLKAVRQKPHLRDVPAIFLSAAHEPKEAKELGALGWLKKGSDDWGVIRNRLVSIYRQREQELRDANDERRVPGHS